MSQAEKTPPAPPRGRLASDIVAELGFTVPARDGTLLSCDLARPAGAGRWPVIVMRTPYGKESAGRNPTMDIYAWAREGFVAVVQDARGRFKSGGEGDFVPFVDDAKDGADLIAWAANLPCSTGEVLMTGGSYSGYMQMAAATQQPAALRAIAPCIPIGNPWRTWFYCGGVLELGACATWFMGTSTDILARRHAKDPQRMRAALGRLLEDFEALSAGGLASLPIKDFEPLARNGIGERFFEVVAAIDGGQSPMIQALTAAQDYARITVPAHISGGWYDCFIRDTLDQFVGMRSRGGSAAARAGTRLVVGPWTHGSTSHINGERSFGLASSPLAPGRGLLPDTLTFFRDQLSGATGRTAPVRIFVMGVNQWRDEQEWPLARARVTPWYLASGGHANSLKGDGTLAPRARPSPGDEFTYDPEKPVPTHGGNILPMLALGGPRDQRTIEAREDVLVYSSAVLEEDLEVTGTVVVELWARTSAVDTDFVARLVDVQSDGTAWNLAEGILRGRYRDNPDAPGKGSPLEPGKPYLYRIELHPTSNVFKAGHRVRLDITSSSFPRWARNLNIWDQYGGTLADAEVARQQVLHEEAHPSRVLLPVIPPRTPPVR